MIINSNNKRTFQIVLFVLIGLVALGIGYAGITAVDLIVNGHGLVTASQANFIVHFISTTTSPKITTGTGTAWIDRNDDTIASFEVTGLSKKGDTAVATFTVKNDSKDIGADFSIELEYENEEYFKVTEIIEDNQLKAGESTSVSIVVELLKTPIGDDITTHVSGKVIANPIENISAIENRTISDSTPYVTKSFAEDSWETIQNAVRDGNISKYKLGDIKTVRINNKDYRVRISNLPSNDGNGVANAVVTDTCSDSSYSETACGFVVEFIDIVTNMAMNNSYVQNRGGYPASLVNSYLNDTLFNQLPSDLQSVIADTRVVSGGERGTSTYVQENQKLFLLSPTEIMGGSGYSDDAAKNKTSQLGYYEKNGTTTIDQSVCGCGGCSIVQRVLWVGSQKAYNGSYNDYWLRGASNTSDYYFLSINRYGQFQTGYYNSTLGVAPAFRIK